MVTMLPDTPEGRALEFLRKGYPGIYDHLRASRPDIIRSAMSRTINPMGGLGDTASGGILDSILDFAKAAVPVYQQQQIFNAQLKAATQTPITQIQKPPVTVRTSLPAQWYKSPLVIGGGLLVAGVLAFFLFRRKRR